MLKFYYHPLSPIACRVWIALLEKDIPFEPIPIDLRGEQFQPEFLALNPFHRVPVIVNDNVRVIESFAILDYLECKYPTPSLMPRAAEEIARMRMVQAIAANELVPKIPALVNAETAAELSDAAEQCGPAWRFLSDQLGNRTYLGGDTIDLADIVAGAAITLGSQLGLSLDSYPTLNQWLQRLVTRPAWQATAPSDADLSTWKRWVRLRVKRHQQRQQRRTLAQSAS
ncbi:MAG: glutathione S-transferase family protein [Cyanobacteria bacterium P01_F01_bin.33]